MRDSRVAWFLRHEAWCVYCIGTLAFVAIPICLGHLGIVWDALNHHFYLGWTAEHPRFDQDYVAAGYQSYQYPYLYWPAYKLAMAGVSGTTAGVVLALFHSLAIPPVWMIARELVPGDDEFAAAMRSAAVLLAFLTGVALSLFDSTSNDLLAAIPLVWAYAFALRPVADPTASAMRYSLLSGVLAGMSVAFKLSNGPLVLALPLLWLWQSGTFVDRVRRCLVAGVAVLAGCGLFYGYWGWQLWTHFGNPIYPLADPWFAALRDVSGRHP